MVEATVPDAMSDPTSDPTSDRLAAAAAPFTGLEVATVSSDALRASIRVSGVLAATTGPLLTSVLRTHIATGRRYLRVDLATAVVADDAVIRTLVEAHRAVTDLGGMLILENAGPALIEAVRGEALFVREG